MCKSIRKSSISTTARFLIFPDPSRIPSGSRRGCGDFCFVVFHFPGGRGKGIEPFQKAADRRGFPPAGSGFQGGLMDRSGGEKGQQKKTKESTASGIRWQWVLLKNIRLFPCPEPSPSRALRSLSLSKKVGWRGGFLKPLGDMERGQKRGRKGDDRHFHDLPKFSIFSGIQSFFWHSKIPFGGLSGGKEKAGKIIKVHPGERNQSFKFFRSIWKKHF